MILVTGGTGVMGRKLLEQLKRKGAPIRIFTLPGATGLSDVLPYVNDVRYGTIASEKAIRGICKGVDTVYHLASVIVSPRNEIFETVNVQGTKILLDESKRTGVRHFIYISSASVVYPKPTPYSLSKRRCETMVQESGLHYTIVRPTLVYDKGRGGREFDMFLDYLKRFPVIPFIGRGKAIKRPVYVDDIVSGLASLYQREDVFGKFYNFSGPDPVSIRDFSRFCLQLLSMPGKPIIPVPVILCRMLAYILKIVMQDPPLKWQVIAGITQDADLDPAGATRDLGFDPKSLYTMLPQCFPRA